MPNWCENHLSIYGDETEMNKFISVISTGQDDFKLLETLYPTPEDLLMDQAPMPPNHTDKQKENLEKYGYSDWYKWRIDNWGCKWAESDLRVEQEFHVNNDRAVIAFGFETPWGPPIEAFTKIAKDYPTLLFCLYYEETGMGFCGTNIWAKGEMVDSVESQIIDKYFDEEYLYNQHIKENN